MNKKLIIFGTGKIADVIYYYAKEECGFEVVAFTVNEEFNDIREFNGLQVHNFEKIEERFPSSDYEMFVAIGYHDLNGLREQKCDEALSKGYELISIISPNTNLPSNVTFGYNCFIMPPALVHPHVEIGNNVFIWNGAMVGHHSKLGDNVWLTSSCNISGNVKIGRNTFLAVNATVGHSILIGDKCFLGANSLITKDAPEKSVFVATTTSKFRLDSDQFLRLSSFTEL